MKDIGCLTINEDKSNTVHIGKLKDGKRPLPRVLLIDVQTLRDNAEKYELFANRRASNPVLSIAPAASSRNTGAVPQVSDTAKSDYPPPVVYIV